MIFLLLSISKIVKSWKIWAMKQIYLSLWSFSTSSTIKFRWEPKMPTSMFESWMVSTSRCFQLYSVWREIKIETWHHDGAILQDKRIIGQVWASRPRTTEIIYSPTFYSWVWKTKELIYSAAFYSWVWKTKELIYSPHFIYELWRHPRDNLCMRRTCAAKIRVIRSLLYYSLQLKKDKANGSIAFIGLLWSINALPLLQNDSVWLLETLDSKCRQKWRWILRNKFVVVCKCPGFAQGGMLVVGIDSHIMMGIPLTEHKIFPVITIIQHHRPQEMLI